MFCDIILPSDNEEKFIQKAIKLNINALCLTYQFSNDYKKKIQKFDLIKKNNKTPIQLFLGFIVEKNKVRSAKQFCDLTLLKGSLTPDTFKHGADIIFGLETLSNRESIYHPASGLPISLIRDNKNRDKCIAISLKEILNNKNKPLILHKTSFNLKLCKKNKIPIIISSFATTPEETRNPNDISSFIRSLGGNTQQSKNAIQTCYEIINTNIQKKKGNIISKGIKTKR